VKINGGGSIKPVSPTSTPDVSAGKPAGPQGPAAPAPAQDKVEINSVSAQLAQLEKLLGDVSVVDSARVESIKQAISEGRFRIDSDMVADKLLAAVREYLTSQQRS